MDSWVKKLCLKTKQKAKEKSFKLDENHDNPRFAKQNLNEKSQRKSHLTNQTSHGKIKSYLERIVR